MYMLDTNICSYILKKRPLSVLEKFKKVGAESLSISTIVLAELCYGASKHPSGNKIQADINDFASRLCVIGWSHQAARYYGDIRANLERAGMPIGNMDLMIAAHALSIEAILVTNNMRHFRSIPDLQLENWI